MDPNKRQVAGSHYAAPIQHWDYVILALGHRYLEGNITKYVTRHRKKNGIQDLQKALHYLDKLRDSFEKGNVSGPGTTWPEFPMGEFISGNGLNTLEAYVCNRLATWEKLTDLDIIRNYICDLILDAEDEQRRQDAIKCGFSAEPGTPYTNQG